MTHWLNNAKRGLFAYLMGAIFLAGGVLPARAQGSAGDSLEVTGRNFILLRVPITVTVRSLGQYDWGLRVKLAGTMSLLNFTSLTEVTLKQASIVGLEPGVEFLIPLRKGVLLRPFLDVGLATPSSSRDIAPVWLSSTGLKMEFLTATRSFIFGFEPGVQFFLSKSARSLNSRNKVNAFVKADARYPLPFTTKGHRPDLGAYLELGYLTNGLDFLSVQSESLDVQRQYEVGLSLGFSRSWPRLLFIKFPRLSVGYRGGNDLSGFRIRLGGDWIMAVPEPDAR